MFTIISMHVSLQEKKNVSQEVRQTLGFARREKRGHRSEITQTHHDGTRRSPSQNHLKGMNENHFVE